MKKSLVVFWGILLSLSILAIPSLARVTAGDKYWISLENREFEPPAESIANLTAKAASWQNQHVLIQFDHIPTEAEKTSLRDKGINLVAYIPNYSWHTYLTTTELSPSLGIRTILPIEITDKISPYILENGIAERGIVDVNLAEVIVVFFSDVSEQDIKTLADKYGSATNTFFDTWEISLNPDDLYKLAAEDIVQWIEDIRPDKITHLNYVRYNIGADAVQSSPYNLHGNGYTAAMWDGGSAWTHTDYNSRRTVGDGSASEQHATLVAGIMLGDGTRSQYCGGSAYIWRGIATEATLITYDWNSPMTEHNSAINTYHADVSQHAWGWNCCISGHCDEFGDYDADSRTFDAIGRGIWGGEITIVASAGNDGECTLCSAYLPHYPFGTVSGPIGTSKNALSVGCTHANDNSLWSESSRGPTDDGRMKPDICAPGCKTFNGVTSTYTNNCYSSSFCGTSFASPAVSGSAILMYEEFNNRNSRDPLPSTIRAIFYHTAYDLGATGPDYTYGYGRIDVHAAVDLIIEDAGLGMRIIEDQISTSEVDEYEMNIGPGFGPLRVTLAWSDREATAGSGIKLVNNLDLELESPTHTVYHPYILDPDNPNYSPSTGIDNLNNMEQIFVTTSFEGTWILRITGTAVPWSPQTYSLIGHFEAQGYEYLPGDVNMSAGTWPPAATGPDVTYLVNFFRGAPTSQSCLLGGFWCSADANGDCNIIGSDVTKLVNVFRGLGSVDICPDYPTVWPTPADLPPSAPPDWPNCE